MMEYIILTSQLLVLIAIILHYNYQSQLMEVFREVRQQNNEILKLAETAKKMEAEWQRNVRN